MPEPPPPRVRERLRELPSVDRLATSVARAELAERRAQVLGGDIADVDLVARPPRATRTSSSIWPPASADRATRTWRGCCARSPERRPGSRSTTAPRPCC